jgi:azurin
VTVDFTNNSAVQQHNWVLVNGGEAEAQAIADAGLTAGLASQYLPADKANVLANTEVLDGGESGEVTFTAPTAGSYLYICTVPGHYPLMQGTLTVN